MTRSGDDASPLEKVVGLGEKSIRKTYYPELQRRMAELERFRALLEETSDIILVISCSDGKILDANHRAATVLGISPPSHGCLCVSELMAEEDVAEVFSFVCCAGEGRLVLSSVMRRSGGGTFPVEMTLSRVCHEGGWYTIAICRDITDRIQAEEGLLREAVLERVNEELENRVRERTRELERAKEAAEAANRAKSEFLANMSHEMRTPLTGVLGMLDLVLDMGIGEDERKFLELSRRSGESLLRLISDILDYVSLEGGILPLHPTDFPVSDLVASAAASISREAGAKGLTLDWEVDPNLGEIRGDEARMSQVLTTLLRNAVKFTEQGGVTIRARRGEDGCAVFSVLDTGIGIPEERFAEVFQKFTQVDASSTRRYGGAGLGLALCRLLVERMGGSIRFESRVGKGSEFVFSVPLGE